MRETLPLIGVVQDSGRADIQRLFHSFFERWQSTVRIVGLIEAGAGAACEPGARRHLVSVPDGQRFRIFQDLGQGSGACQVDSESLLTAGELVRRRIEAGCDLVILSKFARLEAEQRAGLMPTLVSAVEAGIPVLTSVSARFDAEWKQFAEDQYVSLSANASALDAWWRGVFALKSPLFPEANRSNPLTEALSSKA